MLIFWDKINRIKPINSSTQSQIYNHLPKIHNFNHILKITNIHIFSLKIIKNQEIPYNNYLPCLIILIQIIYQGTTVTTIQIRFKTIPISSFNTRVIDNHILLTMYLAKKNPFFPWIIKSISWKILIIL